MSKVNDLIRQKIVKSVQKVETEQALSDYLLRVALKLKGKSFEDTEKTLWQACHDFLQRTDSAFLLRLEAKPFEGFEWFALSTGLHIIAAPSGAGKTLWALQWAKAAALKGHSVLFLSLEMTHEDLAARIYSELSGLPLLQVATRTLTPTQRKLLASLAEETEYLKHIHVDKFGSLDWTQIQPRLWDQMIKMKPKLVIIDFIQMIHDSQADDDRLSRIYSNIARELKLFGDKTESAVLLLSQMNREALKEIEREKWADKVPLSHSQVKESGGIVEAADSVQLVCIPERFKKCPYELRGRFQVTVDKNRKTGELGTNLFPISLSYGGRFG